MLLPPRNEKLGVRGANEKRLRIASAKQFFASSSSGAKQAVDCPSLLIWLQRYGFEDGCVFSRFQEVKLV